MDHERYREWLDLALDSGLDEAEQRRLEGHLADCSECRQEATALRAFRARLEDSVMPVRAGFAHEVMAALEPAPWEARTLRAWRLPFVLLLVLGGSAAALFGGAAAGLDPGARTLGAFLALADLFGAALIAGGGLAAASWRGLGLGVGQWLSASPLNLVAAAVLVTGLNFLLYRLVRRTARPAEARALRSGH
jgi:anti-sigma factor RsiW